MIKLLPAYGRFYNTKEDAIQDWLDGKDFKIAGGPYTSIRDIVMLKDMYGDVLCQYFPPMSDMAFFPKREVEAEWDFNTQTITVNGDDIPMKCHLDRDGEFFLSFGDSIRQEESDYIYYNLEDQIEYDYKEWMKDNARHI